MLNITVITGTRADYGLLYWLIKDLNNNPKFKLNIVATGSHLSKIHGNTFKEIEKDGFKIKQKIKILGSKDDSLNTSLSTSRAIKGFAEYFNNNKVDLVIILGDRYEILASCIAAMLSKIPLMHIHGGELTSGAYDDSIRHAITKMSHYHCTTNLEHMKRVIQLGENPERVKNFGAPGLEYLKRSNLLSKKDLSNELGFELNNFFLFTYHPETLSNLSTSRQIKNILKALDSYKDYKILFTYPNADSDGKKIIKYIENYSKKNLSRSLIVPSLGQVKYLSALSACDLLIGNSSSGLIEAPSANVPTVNIGNRQENRTSAKSVINVENDTQKIVKSISKGLSKEFRSNKNIYNNPYGEGRTSQKIIEWLMKLDIKNKKFFYDLPFKELD
ncbi:MAG: UDP-N-acetylglucosamine 2-epimerase (hydrolyzing) [Rickettsiales bacterium TMED289]|nr:MAG: UDP-N-acetylglucosamine 2-epimerase (hydrolyzing) [Rickettsiales bacterium TMED289]|tara:strand:+ start:5536 stop:6699 length:1164 start_codon:yes stop_codon:yes gene_type:complete